MSVTYQHTHLIHTLNRPHVFIVDDGDDNLSITYFILKFLDVLTIAAVLYIAFIRNRISVKRSTNSIHFPAICPRIGHIYNYVIIYRLRLNHSSETRMQTCFGFLNYAIFG